MDYKTMLDFSFRNYCLSILKDSNLSNLSFYKDEGENFTYKELLEASLTLKEQLAKFPEVFLALKIKSPKVLFLYLLASVFSEKKIIIIPDLLPDRALKDLSLDIPFQKIITDNDIQLFVSEKNHQLQEIDLDLPRFFLLSSGSTGSSKAYGISLQNILSSVFSLQNEIPLTPQDSTFINLPHHHIGGLMIFWRAFLSMGSTTKIENDYSLISQVPLQLKRALDDKTKISQLKKCKAIFIGGGLFDQTTKEKAKSLNLNIFETYGMTETTSMVLLNGKPLANQEIQLDSEGHFMIKGPTLSMGYYQNQLFHPIPVDSEGFYHTKDCGTLSPSGEFSFQHRSDLLFKSAGEMINPLIIESKVKELPFIQEAVVVPVAHPKWTNAATLIIYTERNDNSLIDEVKLHLKESLHPYQIPKFIFTKDLQRSEASVKPKRSEVKKIAIEEFHKSIFHYHYEKKNDQSLIVIFHGFMEDLNDMKNIFPDSHHSLLFIDLPGHGKSPLDHYESRGDIFIGLKNLIESFKEKEIVYYGYSMGGRVALELALFYKSPRKLIIESGSFGLPTQIEKEKRLKSDLSLFEASYNPHDFFNEWYKNPIFYHYNQSKFFLEDLEKKKNYDYKLWQKSLAFFSPGSSPYLLQDIIIKLQSASFKISAIFGEHDLKYKEQFKLVKKEVPNLNLFEIKNAGHNPHKTHQRELVHLINELL